MKIRSKKQGGDSSKPEIDWDLFKSKYENMKRVGKGTHRTMDVDGMNMIYDALYDKGFNQRQIEAVLGILLKNLVVIPMPYLIMEGLRDFSKNPIKDIHPKSLRKIKSDLRGISVDISIT